MGKIKFGWRVPAFPVDGADGAPFAGQILNTLTQLDDKFDSAWVADHFIPWARFQAEETPTLECLASIAFLAGRFPRLHFGSIVLCQSYRNPALLAKMGATLQLLTGGRFILGIGAGWKQDEYVAYGYEFPKPAVRIKQLEETVQIIHKLWSADPADRPATFVGRHYQIHNAWCEPRPNPRPPLLIGAGGEQLALRVVARYADWYNFPGNTLEHYAHKLDVLRSHCDAVGRDYDEIVKTWANECIAVADSEAAAQRMSAATPFGHFNSIVGTPVQVAEKLRAFTALGCQHFILRFADFPNPEGALRFAEEVIPLVQES